MTRRKDDRHGQKKRSGKPEYTTGNTYKGGPELVVGGPPTFRAGRGIRRCGETPQTHGTVNVLVKDGVPAADKGYFVVSGPETAFRLYLQGSEAGLNLELPPLHGASEAQVDFAVAARRRALFEIARVTRELVAEGMHREDVLPLVHGVLNAARASEAAHWLAHRNRLTKRSVKADAYWREFLMRQAPAASASGQVLVQTADAGAVQVSTDAFPRVA